jgi:hypothetical protein
MQITASVMVCTISRLLKTVISIVHKRIGETIKEGTPIATVMPSEYDIAVETFVNLLTFL